MSYGSYDYNPDDFESDDYIPDHTDPFDDYAGPSLTDGCPNCGGALTFMDDPHTDDLIYACSRCHWYGDHTLF